MLKKYPTVDLRLTLKSDKVQGFYPLLQHGFMVKVRVGCSIKMMLCRQFGLSPKYVEERIQTIFLDGKAVDDIDSAIIKDGSILALSAAMPGLAGATLRRGGPLASFRSQATHREGKKAISRREGLVVLKLFNLLVEELGPMFLERGMFVSREDLESLLSSLPGEFWGGCKGAYVDGEEVGLDHLRGITWLDNCDLVMLRVDCGGRPLRPPLG
jgi:hypothetical protein